MRIEKGRFYAVITGDIIASSRLLPPDRQRLLGVMKDASSALKSIFKGSVPLAVDIFRGDSWQVLVARPEKALNAALYFRAFLMARMAPVRVDTRLAIGVGPVDFVPEERVSSGDGLAYRLSGRTLEDLKGHSRMAIEFPTEMDAGLTQPLKIVVSLIDALVVKWTPKQAEAVLGALAGLNQEEIGAKWPGGSISQQAVAQHLAKAGWHQISQALDFVAESVGSFLA